MINYSKNQTFRREKILFLSTGRRSVSNKLLIILLVLAIGLPAATSSYGQSVLLSHNLKKQTVQDVLDEIEKKSDFSFFYNNKQINTSRLVSVNTGNKDVFKILDELFEGTDVGYKLLDNTIILSSKGATETNGASQQQNRKISGTVTDGAGLPIPGVSIMIKGTTNGTQTDVDGKYTITVPIGTVMQYSFLGFSSKNVSVGNQTTIDVTLDEEVDVMDEIVVVGYGTQRKVNLSGAVSTVSPQAVKNRPVTSVGQMLQGTVANMNIEVSSGSANSSPTYNIRGYTSLTGGSPLIVIDGIVSDNDMLNRLNPTDIENISVLKDAASSAIYGSRAAFGVILVTTKGGKSDKLVINYNNNFAWSKITQMPDIITDPFLVAETRNIMSAPWYNLYDEEELAYAKNRSENLSLSPYFIKPNGEYSYFGNTDWVKEAYKNSAMSTNHSVDISGKGDKASYFFSGGYFFQDGIVKYGTDKYNRYNLRSKTNFNLTDFWTVGNNTSIIIADYDSPRYLNSNYYWNINRLSPLDVPTNPDGTWSSAGASVLGRMRDGGRRTSEDIMISAQFDSRLDIVKNVLFVKGNFAYNGRINNQKSFTLPTAYYNGPELQPLYYDETTSASGSNYKTKHIALDVYGTFTKTFNKHAVSAIVGFNQEEYRYEYMSAGRQNLISTSLPSWNLAIGDMSVDHSVKTWALRGAFGRFNYTFADKYIVEFNGRYDGTSRFPKKDRFAFNPSASAAWVVSNEKFFEPISNLINFLKFRASYGSLGNQDVKPYEYISQMSSGSKTSAILDGLQPSWVSSSGLVSGKLTWEKVITKNAGVDLNLLNNRFTLAADIYTRETKDMLTNGQDLPVVLGTAIPLENAADLKTQGWEITVGWKDKFEVASKPFSYSVSFNLADSKAHITKFVNANGSLSSDYVGKELGEIWGMETEGFFTSLEDVANHADQKLVSSYLGTRPLEPGDIKFKDRDESGAIDWGRWTVDDHGDYFIIGNSWSRYTFGLSMGAEWNGIDISILLQGVGKKDYAPGPSDLYFFGIYSQPWTNTTYGNYYDRWTPETPNAYFPRFKSYVAEQHDVELGATQTKYLQNAAYIRAKNVTIGYTIPEKITQKIKIDRLRVFFSGDNLFEMSGLYKHYKVDPEGLGGQMYPFQRYYSLGVNLTF